MDQLFENLDSLFEDGNDGYLKDCRIEIYNTDKSFMIVIVGEMEEMSVIINDHIKIRFDFDMEYADFQIYEILYYIQDHIIPYKDMEFTIECECYDDYDCEDWMRVVIDEGFKMLLEEICEIPSSNIKTIMIGSD